PISFSDKEKRVNHEEKEAAGKKKKEIDKEELKNALRESLDDSNKETEDLKRAPQKGKIEPGETVKF
ncbi:unnamed protein product, partial [marine sediment metagenome]